MEDRSLLRWLSDQGIRPILLDWGSPETSHDISQLNDDSFSLSDYMAVAARALIATLKLTDTKSVALMGYCMGGTIAMGLASLHETQISRLGLLATPWDFHADNPAQAQSIASSLSLLEPILQHNHVLPVDHLQSFFTLLDPMLGAHKFSRLNNMPQDAPQTDLFIAVEDWLNDGVSLAANLTRDCFQNWYGLNQPAMKHWKVNDQIVDPANFKNPALLIMPAQDKIVPPKGAAALAKQLPNATILQPPFGHIGMIIANGAKTKVWKDLVEFLIHTD
jgi:polyhydroxyalkanoate synthase